MPARTIKQLCQTTLRELQKSINSLYIHACSWDKWHPPGGEEVHPKSIQAFRDTWIDSGIARFTLVKSLPVVLRAPGH